MSNSSLVTCTRISPNRTSPRNHEIDTVTVHCFVSQVSAERGLEVFDNPSKRASCNYVVGYDGKIGLCVEEKDASWCSSSSKNDNRAITIEVASDTFHPYAVTDRAYESLIKLLADICKRNGIKELKWKADKSLIGKPEQQNMTVHRWFANKSCPGEYLYSRHSDIATKVNALLNGGEDKPLYRVQIGAFSVFDNAVKVEKDAKSKGFDTYLVRVGNLYKVQIGAFAVESNATAMLNKAKSAGFSDSFITTEAGEPVNPPKPEPVIVKGSKVRVKKGAKTYNGKSVASFVYDRVYPVDELSGDRAVLDTRGLCTAFNVKDLILCK